MHAQLMSDEPWNAIECNAARTVPNNRWAVDGRRGGSSGDGAPPCGVWCGVVWIRYMRPSQDRRTAMAQRRGGRNKEDAWMMWTMYWIHGRGRIKRALPLPCSPSCSLLLSITHTHSSSSSLVVGASSRLGRRQIPDEGNPNGDGGSLRSGSGSGSSTE